MASSALERAVTTGAIFARRYRLVRRISAGGMAEVYEVEHLGTRRRLALKVLLPEVMADAESVERFQREASVCANIDSDHVVGVIDCDVDAASGMPFLVMELLNGKDLSQYIADTWGRGAPIPASMVLSLVRQVASALDKVHAHGIVHRDLKPANLFLSFPSDSAPRVKILDFGVAKLTREKRTSNASRLGTPLYMAAEQLSSTDTVSAATDVSALALITYELFVGVAYWDGNTAASLAERIPDRAQHPKPSMLAAARGIVLAPGFDQWLLRCIDPAPARRPATAGEAIGELLRLFDPNATQPPPRTSAAAPIAPAAPSLGDTQRRAPDPRPVTAPSKPAAKPGAMRRPAHRPIASDTIPMPTVGALMAAQAEADEAARAIAPRDVDASEKPTIPASGRQIVSRVRDASETRTTKMPVLRQRVQPVDAAAPETPAEAPAPPPAEVQPLAFALARPRTPAHPSPAPAAPLSPAAAPVDGPPLPTSAPRAAPKDLFAQRISQAADESEAAANPVEAMRRRGVAPNALTALLPVAAPRPRSVRPVTIAIAALATVAIVSIAAIVTLRRRAPDPSTRALAAAPSVTSLTAEDRATLRRVTQRCSAAIVAQQNADGGFGARAAAPTSGGDTATRLAALVRGHVVGASVAPARQLSALQALDNQRLAEGWGFEVGDARRATTEGTAWATVAYALVAQESRADTARARVRIARQALVAAQNDDGGFSEGVLPMGTTDAQATSMAALALFEAQRADPAGEATNPGSRVLALARARHVALDPGAALAPAARAFWVLWRGRREAAVLDADATATRFAGAMLARCEGATGCGAEADPWVALAATALLRDPPSALSATAARSVAALRASVIARGARQDLGSASASTLSAWLFAAAELQR